MSRSHRLSSGSVSCRLEWRPSYWLQGALAVLGLLAAWSVLLSEMPRWAAWPMVVGVLAYMFASIYRERRRPARCLVFPGGDGPVQIDGLVVESVTVHWRGPLAFVTWQERGGNRQRLSWWPDTLPPERRRELRLAAGLQDASRRRPGMAP
jgi:toxin CptA